MFIAIFIGAIVFAIVLHEFGHFVTAKLFGMRAERFFVGFGPTLWSVHRGETEYGLKAIPAGGFVKITGMSVYEHTDPADEGRTFHSKPAWQRAIVLSAGSITHVLVAAVLLFVALAVVGLPTGQVTNVVGMLTEDGPAAAAGLETGDRILSVDGEATPDFDAVRAAVLERPGETVPVTVERDGQTRTVDVAIASQAPDGQEVGFLGVGPEPEIAPLPASEALVATFTGDFSIVRIAQLTLAGLGEAFSPAGLSAWFSQLGSDAPRTAEEGGLVSLVGATQIAGTLGQQGDLFGFLVIIVQINLVLGILNMLPLPPLDGGHLAVLLVEKGVNGVRSLRGRPADWTLDPARLTPIALVVILFFGTIMITAVIMDILRPASEILQ